MYQPPIDNVNTQTNTHTNTKPNLAELFKSADVQKDYQELASKEERQKMEMVYDRPITVMSFETTQEETNFGGKPETKTFTKIHFVYSDDPERLPHYCLTQASSLKTALESVGNERLKQYGGIPTMICARNMGAKKSIYFDGLESI